MKPGFNGVFSSESVTEGHPDKVCDVISDSILDACLEQDPESRVACETLVKGSERGNRLVVLAGEITTQADVDYELVARDALRRIGYDEDEYPGIGFSYRDAFILNALSSQSPDISQGVNFSEGLFEGQGAGDQGMMFGYACDETPELMPMAIALAHALTRKLSEFRCFGSKRGMLRPDGKSEVSVRYEDGRVVGLDTIVLSTHHSPDYTLKAIRKVLKKNVVRPVCEEYGFKVPENLFVNSTGRFVVGGPVADCGLTGRKIIVDTYGGMGRHGGGAFSGKDPSKVDRSAAYAARWAAKSVVASGLASRCEVQLAYAIGVAEPVGVYVDTFGTGRECDREISEIVRENFDFKPAAIIGALDLKRPGYRETASGGHFGRDGPRFTWELTKNL